MSKDDTHVIIAKSTILQILEHHPGCGDSLCTVRRTKGVHTNGGCRCFRGEDRVTIHKIIWEHKNNIR